MPRLWLDFETKSDLDLAEVGVYRYVTHPSTRVLMMAYAFEDDPPQLWFPGDPYPICLAYENTEWWAFNAAFERLVFKHVLKWPTSIRGWRCAQVLARYHSLPANLGDAGNVLGLAADEKKIADGAACIRMFCMPYIEAQDRPLFGPTPAVYLNELTNPVEWARFCEYAKSDILAERAIVQKMEKVSELPQREWENYWIDQEINDRGIPVDTELVGGALKVIGIEKARLWDDLVQITKLENPNSDQQMLGWCRANGYAFQKIGKDFVRRALAGEGAITPECRKVLLLRTQLAKSSVDKFDAFGKMVVDGQLHHQFKFMGAARTGRWSGSGVQFQNLRRPEKNLEDETVLNRAVELLTAGDIEGIRSEFQSSVLDVASSCIRPVFRARPKSKFIIADLSQIESIIVGWESDCTRIIKVYTAPPPYDDAYKDFAVDMYGIPYEEVTKAQRNICKPCCLGANYALSPGREETNKEGDTYLTGLLGYAAAMGVQMTPEEAEKAITIYREKFPEVVQTWWALERAFVSACYGVPAEAGKCHFEVKENVMRVRLPSGRYLHYLNPRVAKVTKISRREKEYTATCLYYQGQDATTHQWVEVETSGGKILENATQAIARDILMEGIRRAELEGFEVVAHVHDEIVAEVPYSSMLTAEDLVECMAAPVIWAPGLPLKAAAFESERYRKE